MSYEPTVWRTGDTVTAVKLNKIEQGLANIDVDITVDSTLTQEGEAADAKAVGDALVNKVSVVDGKGLSTNDYTTAEKTKLSGIDAGANNTTIDDTLSHTGQAADAKATGDAVKGVAKIGGQAGTYTSLLISDTSETVDLVEQSTFDAEIAKFNAKIGSPLKATTVSQMTDGNKIYVYVGSENGYTNGNWYYHNGTAWVSGGVYNSTAFETDDTLAIQGMAADSKKVGDELDSLMEDLTQINDQIIRTYPSPSDIITTGGYWAVVDGGFATSGSWARSNQQIDDSILSITLNTNAYKMFLLAYENDTYIGTWFGNGFEKTYDTTYVSRYIDLLEFRKKYPTYQFKLDITGVSGTLYNFNDIITNIVFTQSVVKSEENTIKKIFGNIAITDLWEYGTINSTGVKSMSSEILYKRISTIDFVSIILPITIVPQSGYALSVTTYAKDGTFEQQSSAWITTPITLSNVEKLYKIVIKAVSESNLALTDIGNYIESKLLANTPFDRLLAECMNVKAVNHRGYNTIAPENTLPAFEMSASLGFKYVECDVLFTSDGVPVIMHDDTINRTCCNADGTAISDDVGIESVSYNDLIANYDACTTTQWATWKGTKVPTFEQFMNCCKALNLHPWIELKWTHTYTQAEVQSIIAKIKKYGMEEHVTFISFSYDALALVATEWDTVELGLNGSVSDAIALKTGKNRVFMIYNASDNFSDAVSAGIQICLYTIDTVSSLTALNNRYYDSILTNTLLPSQVSDTVRAVYEV